MAALFHFLPHCSLDALGQAESLDPARRGRLAPVLLAEYGLDRVLADCGPIGVETLAMAVQKGPGGGPGVLLYPRAPQGKDPRYTVYRPHDQVWHEVAAPPGHARAKQGPLRWIGWETANPPTPPDLARRRQISGQVVVDDAGRAWLVPTARSPANPHGRLPVDYSFDAAGKPFLRLKPSLAALWESAGVAFATLTGQGEHGEAELVSIALAALSVNYRVGPAEMNALAAGELVVLDTHLVVAILQALVDWPAWLAALEKKTAGTLASTTSSEPPFTPGGGADSPVTGPAAASLP